MCVTEIQKSRIFTTEPELTRALAAEIRNDSTKFLQLIVKLLKQPLDNITRVACEEKERIDIVLTCSMGGETKRIGIEAKCDHIILKDQIDREKKVVDYLILLVLEEADADSFKEAVDGVLTWNQVLGCFNQSRLTQWDLDNMFDGKRVIERSFMKIRLDMQQILPETEWDINANRNGSGQPHIDICSREYIKVGNKEKQIRGNIQVTGRGTMLSQEEVTLQGFLGIDVDVNDPEDFPSDVEAFEPAWIIAVKRLDSEVIADNGIERYPELAFRGRAGTRRRSVPHMAELVDRYLYSQRYLYKGFKDWAFGAKSKNFSLSDLEKNAVKIANLFNLWKHSLEECNREND